MRNEQDRKKEARGLEVPAREEKTLWDRRRKETRHIHTEQIFKR